jgi:hypothetical protein
VCVCVCVCVCMRARSVRGARRRSFNGRRKNFVSQIKTMDLCRKSNRRSGGYAFPKPISVFGKQETCLFNKNYLPRRREREIKFFRCDCSERNGQTHHSFSRFKRLSRRRLLHPLRICSICSVCFPTRLYFVFFFLISFVVLLLQLGYTTPLLNS